MKNKKIRCPFKIHGGKFYLSEWIISHFPENYQNYIYVEPYVGAGSIFINKMPSTQMEIINERIQNFFWLRATWIKLKINPE